VNFVLVPVKALAEGKTRLSPMLSEAARRAVSRAMLTDVVSSVLQVPAVDRVAVVSSDPSLLALARGLGALAVDEGWPRGLNGATSLGTDFCVRHGATTLLVLLSDLPLIQPRDIARLFAQLSGRPEILLVRCKYGRHQRLSACAAAGHAAVFWRSQPGRPSKSRPPTGDCVPRRRGAEHPL